MKIKFAGVLLICLYAQPLTIQWQKYMEVTLGDSCYSTKQSTGGISGWPFRTC